MDNMVVETAKTLPLWVQITSSVIGVLGFLLSAILGIDAFLRVAELEVKVTKDTFYRIIERGEVLFVRATLLARKGPVLITSVFVTLEKVDRAKKTFPLSVEQFGTLIPKPESLGQEHNYYGRSVAHFLEGDKPQRLVYFCLHETADYAKRQEQCFDAFDKEVKALGLQTPVKLSNASELTDVQREQIDAVINKHIDHMFASLQLETGSYKLKLRIEYESTNARFRGRKPRQVESTISFDLPRDLRNAFDPPLRDTLQKLAELRIFGIQSFIAYPQISPLDITEH